MKHKFIRNMVIVFISVISAFIFSNSKISAECSVDTKSPSFNLYYPNTVLASEYNKDGTVNFKTIDVYTCNNGLGYSLHDRLKVSSVKVGEDTPVYSVVYGSDVEKFDINSQYYPSELISADKNLLDKITITIPGKFASQTSNSINISINIQDKVTKCIDAPWYYFGGCKEYGWQDSELAMNVYKGDTLKTSDKNNVGIVFNKTDTTFASNNIVFSPVFKILNKNGSCNSESLTDVFGYSNWLNQEILMLCPGEYTFQGELKLNINDATGRRSKTINTTYLGKSSTSESFLRIYKDIETSYKVTACETSSISDKYGSVISNPVCSLDNSEIKVDTKNPTILSGSIEQNGATLSGVQDIDLNFSFSEKAIFDCVAINYRIGELTSRYEPSGGCGTIDTINNSASQIITVKNVSGNGILIITSIEGKLTDVNGNVANINYNEVIGNLVLESPIKKAIIVDASFSESVIRHYYQNDKIYLKLELSDSASTDAQFSFYLLNSQDNKKEFDYCNKESGYYICQYTINEETNYDFTQVIGDQLIDNRGNKIEDVARAKIEPIGINEYFDLSFEASEEKIELYHGDDEIKAFSNIQVTDTSAILSNYECSKSSDNKKISCTYTNNKDGQIKLDISRGKVVLLDGFKNETFSEAIEFNSRAPEVEVVYDNAIEVENEKYFNAMSKITFNLSDGYPVDSQQWCLYYKYDLDSDEYESECGRQVTIALSSISSDLNIYYYTSDGENDSIGENSLIFLKYHGVFNEDKISIKINDGDSLETKYFNYIKLEYDGSENEFVSSFSYSLGDNVKGGPYTDTTKNIMINRDDFNQLNLDSQVELKVTLVDKLGNKLEKSFKINIDLVAPNFDSISVAHQKEGDKYLAEVTDSSPNSDIVKMTAIVKEQDNSDKEYPMVGTSGAFATLIPSSYSSYTLRIEDRAGNTNQRVYVLINPTIEIKLISTPKESKYSIYIDNFNDSLHEITNAKYLVFNYTSQEISSSDMDNAIKNKCAQGRIVNCYSFISGVNVKSNEISKVFLPNYSYIVLVEINYIMAKDKDGNLPRLDVAAIVEDTTAPVISYLESDTNPEYVSSLHGENFEFKFLVSDQHLSSTFSYLVTNSYYSSMSNSKFNEIYNQCGGVSTSECIVKGNKSYTDNGSGVFNLGQDDPNKGTKFSDGVRYYLYVLASDTYGNSSVRVIKDFVNVINNATIRYIDDDNNLVTLKDKESVSTLSSTKVTITKKKYNNKTIELSKILIGVNESVCNSDYCEYDLATGDYTIEVVDVLGNSTRVTIHSGTTANPKLAIYYKVGEEYIMRNGDNFAYNTQNAANVYIKIKDTNISSVSVTMSSMHTYTKNNDIFDHLMTNDEHGFSLSILLAQEENYQGTVTIVVTNNEGKYTQIALNVDNDIPVISLAPVGKININGELVDLTSSDGAYKIDFNYSGLNYLQLMNKLNVKVDGHDFNTIKDNERFKFTLNGDLFNKYENVIDVGTSIIKLNYFDEANNVADEVTINVMVSDTEVPTISINGVPSIIDISEVINFKSYVLASDNYDNELIVTVLVDLSTVSDPENYTFSDFGTYEVKFCAEDSSHNQACVSTNIEVVDVQNPILPKEIDTKYRLGVNKKLVFDLPVFEDNDPRVTTLVAKEDEIDIYDSDEVILDKSVLNYPLTVMDGKVHLKFNEEYNLGSYKIVFKAYDKADNLGEATFYITLYDSDAPEISVKLNDSEVIIDQIIEISYGSNINLEVSAVDGVEGDVSDRVYMAITLEDRQVGEINNTRPGDYVVTYTVKDNSNNINSFTFVVRIYQDEVAPVIEKVLINDFELSEHGDNKVNVEVFTINVDASDNSGITYTYLSFKDSSLTIRNGGRMALDRNISGQEYVLIVKVSDPSDNEIVKEYKLLVDNKRPVIEGVKEHTSYSSKVKLYAFDENLELVEIYKNSRLVASYDHNIEELEISETGTYYIKAIDEYGNVSEVTFMIAEGNYFNFIDTNNLVSKRNYDLAAILQAQFAENGDLIFYLDHDLNITNYDQIYLLIRYPNSDYKYVVHSMNGRSYLANSRVVVDKETIAGLDSSKILDTLGDKSYGYMMVVRDPNAPISENETENGEKGNSPLKYIVIGISSVLIFVLLFVAIIKFKRRIRAV